MPESELKIFGAGQDMARVSALVEQVLEGMGFELVRVKWMSGKRNTLQIMAEPADHSAMKVEDCARISESVSALLDVGDVISEAYVLEVSSPGIDRPLTRPQDFERFAGFEAKIELKSEIAGRRRFRARVMGIAGNEVKFTPVDGGGELTAPFSGIASARLVLTDELINATTSNGVH